MARSADARFHQCAIVWPPMRLLQLFISVLLVVISPLVAGAAEPPPFGSSTDPISVELLTMGPGEHPFFKFGHNAIRIRDARRDTDTVYNYGTFSFSSPTLLQDFFKGRLEYWLSRDTMTDTLEHYREQDRSMVTQRLLLSPEKKLELKRYLDINARPEHRAYKYDYFFDNCSTRVRDAIDHVTDGQLHAALKSPASQSLRDHALRATSDYFLEYLVLSIGLGPLVDRPRDRWDETFLPEMLTEGMRDVTIRAADGTEHALVQAEELLLEHRDTRPSRPPRWTGRFLLAGSGVGALLLLLAQLATRTRSAAIAFGLIVAFGGLIVGLLGLGLVALWAMTDHAVAFRNQNTLLLSPLAILLPWFGMRAVFRGAKGIKAMHMLAFVMTAMALLALCLKGIAVEWQDNGTLIAFFLPCWSGLWAATALAKRRLPESQ